MPDKPTSLDAYLAMLDTDKRAALLRLRRLIASAAPGAEECISYGLPAFRIHGRGLVAMGAAARHCALYPMSATLLARFQADLAGYQTSKGAIRFRPEKPLPAVLVRRLVRARVAENAACENVPPGRAGKVAVPEPRASRPRQPMPEHIREALETSGLMPAYAARPPYQRNDYLGWIARAKQAPTQAGRLARMLDELRRGDVYMKMPYRPKRTG